MPHCVAMILAAGGSNRLGEPKQLLSFEGETLISRVAGRALRAKVADVVVVLGAHADECAEALRGLAVRTVVNAGWTEGIGSSIRVGMAALGPEVDGVVILLCDQPRVSTQLVDELIASGQSLAVSSYGGVMGPPVYFAREFFDELRALHGDEGAKAVIRAHGNEMAIVGFPEGAFDIDTQSDFKQLVTSTTLPSIEVV